VREIRTDFRGTVVAGLEVGSDLVLVHEAR
jgi:hypothetical protein